MLKDYKIIIFNTFIISDKTGSLKVYLITFDNNPSFIFDLWHTLPSFENITTFLNDERQVKVFNR